MIGFIIGCVTGVIIAAIVCGVLVFFAKPEFDPEDRG